METVELNVDFEEIKAAFERYFKFELKRELKKIPILFLLGMSTFLILLGLFTQIQLFWILGIMAGIFLGLFILYYLIRFKIASKQILVNTLKKAKDGDKKFIFSFDSEHIIYESENMNSQINWKLIKRYFINEIDIYVYFENYELLDIISERRLGEEKFNKFKEILIAKFEQEPKTE